MMKGRKYVHMYTHKYKSYEEKIITFNYINCEYYAMQSKEKSYSDSLLTFWLQFYSSYKINSKPGNQ